jgi:ribosome biogenesis GTPase
MTFSLLADLGWSEFFADQLDPDETSLTPARIAEVHRTRALALAAAGPIDLALPPHLPTTDLAVGDWVLTQGVQLLRRLDRQTHLARRAAGLAQTQSIAANIDTLFIVTSCNEDFSEPRLERYLALAAEAGCTPVVLLTKADLAVDPEPYRQATERLTRGLTAVPIDARDPAVAASLADWCGPGRTVALIGSSGVGKTTLTNALTGGSEATAAIREDDAKGRHTTTFRALRPIPGGGWIIDTPGMRAIPLSDVAGGIDATFAEITELAPACKFRDCRHDGEPGCAVAAAIEAGSVDPARLKRWRKLQLEDRQNTETRAEAHARGRSFGKIAREAQTHRRDRRDPGD